MTEHDFSGYADCFVILASTRMETEEFKSRQLFPVSESATSAVLFYLARHSTDLRKCSPSTFHSILACSAPEAQAQMLKYLTSERQAMKQDVANAIPPDILDRLNTSLASLESALAAKDPMLSNHLRSSHQILISYPETVHLLDDTEVARLISAAQVHAKVEIVKAAAAKTTRATAKKALIDEF